MSEQVFDRTEMSPASLAELSRVPDGHPFALINLLLYKEWAQCPPGTVTERLTGRQAYARYAELSIPILNKVGGYPVWRGEFSANLIGPADERWDEILVMQYPSKSAFERMIADPEYLRIAFHRSAAIKDARLYGITSPQSVGPAKWELFKLWQKIRGR